MKRTNTPTTHSKKSRFIIILIAFILLSVVLIVSRNHLLYQTTDSKPSILIITIDTWRWDYIGKESSSFVRTPNIDFLIDTGVYFRNTITASPLTSPSHATIFTGLYPPHHGVQDNGRSSISPNITMLSERFEQAGYNTVAFVSAYPVSSKFGFQQGFQIFNDDFPPPELEQGKFIRQIRGEVTFNRFKQWYLQKKSNERWFAWLHFFDPHAPYEAPGASYTTSFRQAYAGEVQYVDSLIGKIQELLKDNKNILWCIISDHGEGLNDHGEETHGLFLYSSTIRIPWILYGEKIAKPQTVDMLVRSVDVFPTLLDLSGIENSETLDGRSLKPIINGESMVELPAYFETYYGFNNYGVSPLFGAQHNQWKWIDSSDPELYNMVTDPQEITNVFSRMKMPPELQTLKELSQRFFKDKIVIDHVVLDTETIRSLSSLGYLGGKVADSGESMVNLKNPRELLPWFQKLKQARSYYQQGRFDLAENIYLEFIDTFPVTSDLKNDLGLMYSSKGEYDKAEPLFRQIITVDPLNMNARFNLSACLVQLNKSDEAKRELDAILKISPDDTQALWSLGMLCQTQLNDPECVRQAWTKLLYLKPDHPDASIMRKIIKTHGIP